MSPARAGFTALILVAAAAAAACDGASGAETGQNPGDPSVLTLPPAQRARVRTQAVAPSGFAATVQTTGTVAFDADQSTSVLAPISGPVTSILVQPGAEVRKGQPLAYVSSPDFAAAVASYRKAMATYTNAKRVADLDAQLFQNDAIARRDLEQAQTDASNAQADVEATTGQLRALGVDPQAAVAANASGQQVQGIIRAPISGTLVERLITPGQLLQAGTTPCFTIADLSKVWVMANIFPADLARVAVGDRADIATSASPAHFPGTIDYIAALVDPNTKATEVRILVPNPSHFLRRDMYVEVGIQSRRQAQGILIPVAAVLRDDDNQPFVFLQRPDGRYLRRDVQLGERVGDSYAVGSGLAPGERIVSEGGLFLQFAQSQ